MIIFHPTVEVAAICLREYTHLLEKNNLIQLGQKLLEVQLHQCSPLVTALFGVGVPATTVQNYIYVLIQ